jgi:toxin CptA
MDNAPSVTYPVGRPRFAGLVAGALWLAGAAVTLLWWYQAEAPGWRQGVAAMAVALSGAAALRSWLLSPNGDFSWDGAGWTAPGRVGPGTVQVALDLQHRVLIRWRGQESSRWVWLERHRCPQRWADLRRAVYSRARPHALPAARPPAATP